MTALIDEVAQLARDARAKLQQDKVLGQFIDATLDIPQSFMGQGPIKLIIIGQDPTVQRAASRAKIKTVLNLDIDGSLKTYLSKVCAGLGLSLDENVYATNLCKCFFPDPPTTIAEEHHLDVPAASAPVWLPILVRELSAFPEALVITLGEPVLSALVCPGFEQRVGYYWGYNHQTRRKDHPICAIRAEASTLQREIFPFPHQPSLKKVFYRDNLDDYIRFVRTHGAS